MTDPQDARDPNTPRRIDVLQMLRDAQGEAAEVTKAQANLSASLAETEAFALRQNAPLMRLQRALDEIRLVADEAALEAHLLPQPYSIIVQQTVHWIDVADDALKAIQ